MKICAVVVTFNRRDLLKENIEALFNQTTELDKIIIVDNNSNDGTGELLEIYKSNNKNFEYISLKENIGGAGGFNYAIKEACKYNYDYIWIMDDDTVPQYDALEKLLKSNVWNNRWGFLCSKVLWIDDTLCKMNIPSYKKGGNNNELESASFVSLLIKTKDIEEVGLPIKDFFIWGDDLEFTLRLSNNISSGYIVDDSIVVHKMKENISVDISRENSERISRYFYEFRNKYYIYKNQGKILNYYYHFVKTIVKILIIKNNNKLKKLRIMFNGMIKGYKFNPSIEMLIDK